MIHPEVLIDTIGGNCPVQAEGTIDGFPFYFRARGERWTMTVANKKDTAREELYSGYPDTWHYEEPYGDGPFAAGWMEEKEALAFIYKAADLFKTSEENV